MATRQIRAKAADPFVDVNNVAGEMAHVGVMGSVATYVTMVMPTVSAGAVVRMVAAVHIDRGTWGNRTAKDAQAACVAIANLDRLGVLRLAKGCDRRRLGTRCPEDADNEDERKELVHCLPSRYTQTDFRRPPFTWTAPTLSPDCLNERTFDDASGMSAVGLRYVKTVTRTARLEKVWRIAAYESQIVLCMRVPAQR